MKWVIENIYTPTIERYSRKLGVKPTLREIYREYNLVRHGSRTPYDREMDIVDDFCEMVQQGDVVFDVGAFRGEYSIQAAMSGASRVIAFEPHPQMIADFRARLDEYDHSLVFRRDLDLIQLEPVALSDVTGSFELVDEWEDGIYPGLAGEDTVKYSTITVQTVRGDDYIDQKDLPEPDILKIDVEGAEMRVLKGLKQTLLSGSCRLIYLEIHPKEGDYGVNMGSIGDDRNELLDYLNELEFVPDEVFIEEEHRINMRLESRN